ncbi:MAG: riboflavin synthase subunit alpha [Deltaproteobacteria bacterium SG8_13]|nr:MAG: riboflavin synthase subunit alpha [Deltaproteobacteria bacterium SG8_13]
MFTGIIEGLGTIHSIRSSGQGSRLVITADYLLENTRIGDSIAVNGACLTAVAVSGKRFEVDVSRETLRLTTLGTAKTGERVNLERALRLSDRIDGHLVAGHVDGTGQIRDRQAAGNSTVVAIGVPKSLSRYLIQKGSVAVDGISLTVNDCDDAGFTVSIVPHTGRVTTIGFKQIGAPVNIETDMIGKYVEKFMTGSKIETTGKGKAGSGVDMDLLAKTGFL